MTEPKLQSLSCAEIRNKWIAYFTEKCERKHKHYKSASLVPDNPTLLLNAAGMVQFVPIFLGVKERPEPPRAISIQKCVRVGGKDSDLENIGRTTRHHSFFEMLGNFSFGDYFKHEVIGWAWDFVTRELGLPAERLYVSVFAGDDSNNFDQEAYSRWLEVLSTDFPNLQSELQAYHGSFDIGATKQKVAGFDDKLRIWHLDRKDNFWGPPGPTGPCGPCSEIYYDLGLIDEFGQEREADDRYVEIWNLVFMELEKLESGEFKPLASKNIDTGAGLERLATILQAKHNSFETDELFAVISKTVSAIDDKEIYYSGTKAKSQKEKDHDLYLKIIADHLRCLCFLIADGVRPSNLGRGYVLRMIIRRAARFLFLLGGSAKLADLCAEVVTRYQEFYPELREHAAVIQDICAKEEEQFGKTISKGTEILEAKLKSTEGQELSGDFVFDLYSTYGFPLEMTEEIAKEQGLEIDHAGYEAAKLKHSEASSTDAFNVSVLNNEAIPELVREFEATKFVGYDVLETEATVLAILDEGGNRVEEIALASPRNDFSQDDSVIASEAKQSHCQVLLDQTSFYAESGGQVSDSGVLDFNGEQFAVVEVKAYESLVVHKLANANLKVGDKVTAKVDAKQRELTRYHHSSCHLLQAALRKVLGPQIQQAGSQVGPEYTRFDFNFDRGLSQDEQQAVEDQMNTWIKAGAQVTTKEMNFDAAIKAGALAFFEDKYEDDVRVVTMGDASVELCGGTHVSDIADIQEVVIASEGSVAAGIRRIKLFAHDLAKQYAVEKAAAAKQASEEEAAREAAKQAAKARKKELEKQALAKLDEIAALAQDQNNNKVLIKNVNEIFAEGLEADTLKTLTEALKDKLVNENPQTLILLASSVEQEDGTHKVAFMAAVSDELIAQDKKYNAGNMVREAAKLCGGGGGGRPNFAQAGAKDASKIEEALEQIASLCSQ